MACALTWAAAIFLGTIMYNCSKIFRYYTKFIFFAVASSIAASIFIPIMFFRPRDSRNALLPALACRYISYILGMRWTIKGHENIVRNEGAVVLINHQSFLDLNVLAHLWPIMDNCAAISKREIMYLGTFGLASWLWGTVFIDRANAKGAQNAVNKASETIQSKKTRILIFPEGTRHGEEKFLPFKKGAFHIAIASKAPIQPVVVSRYTFLDHKNYRFDPGHVTVSILPAIRTDNVNKEEIDRLVSHAHKEMSDEYERLNSTNNRYKSWATQSLN